MATNSSEMVDKAGDFAILPVPKEERKSFLSIMWVNTGFTINLGCIFGGAAVAMFLPLNKVFLALLISAAIQAVFASTIGGIGAKYGLSTTMLSRQSFGRYGSWMVGGILAITIGVGWFGWQVAMFAETIHTIFPDYFLTNPAIASIWGGAIMILTASYGFKGLGILSFIVVPMMIIVFALGIVDAIAASKLGMAGLMLEVPMEQGTLGQGITMAVGISAAGSLAMADITRYGKRPGHAAVSGTVGFLGGALFCEFAGAIMIVATKVLPIGSTPNLIAAMVTLGMGAGALVTLIFAQWTTNDNNLYSGSLGLTNLAPISKKLACIIMGIIGIIIALAGIQNVFVPYLMALGLVVPPMAGVILCDFFILRRLLNKKYVVEKGGEMPWVNILAIIAVIAAALISKYWQTAIPATVLAIVFGFVIYGVLSVVFSKAGIKYQFGKYVITETGF
jgi:cytosine permease